MTHAERISTNKHLADFLRKRYAKSGAYAAKLVAQWSDQEIISKYVQHQDDQAS
jgi:hypothetical protein